LQTYFGIFLHNPIGSEHWKIHENNTLNVCVRERERESGWRIVRNYILQREAEKLPTLKHRERREVERAEALRFTRRKENKKF
jgi:hypothetical protein